MTAFSDRFTAKARSQLFAEHGETVTHYPRGNATEADSLTAMVNLLQEDRRDQQAGLQTDRNADGKRIVRHGTLTCAADVEVDDQSTWLVREEVWRTVRIKGRDASLQIVEIRRAIPIDTRRPRVGKFSTNE